MPIVFVHGVSNRSGTEYQRHMEDREDWLRKTLLRQEDGTPYAGKIIDAFWGEFGARVEGGLRSLPGSRHVALGGAAEEAVDGAALAALGDEFLAEIAAVAPTVAVDLLFAGAEADAAATEMVLPEEVRRFAAAAADLAAEIEAGGSGLDARTNDEVLSGLVQRVAAATRSSATSGQPAFIALGDAQEAAWLQRGLDRLRSIVTGTVSSATGATQATVGSARRLLSLGILAKKRTSWSREAALFLGDALVYLGRRGTSKNLGEIPRRIGERLAEGFASRTPDDPLIVIGHSLGGVILYDLLTGFQPLKPLVDGLNIDVLVTVGSQVGVFAELGQFAVQEGLPAHDPGKQLPRPDSVQRWINIYDRVDVFSFQAEAVFDGVEDYDFSSRTGTIAAHGAYFDQPSFYSRLRTKLWPPELSLSGATGAPGP